MSSKYLTILLAVAAIMLTNSCSSDDMDNILADGPVSAQVTASINNGKTASRVDNSVSATTFETNDVINVVAAQTSIYQYKKTDASTWSAVDTPYYFQDGNDVSFKGWYSTATATDNSISINTATQTPSSTWNDCDILVTPAVTASASSPKISFTSNGTTDNRFAHIMSQVTLTFTAGDGGVDLSNLTGYTLGTLTTDATFNTLTCALSAGTTTGSITQSVSAASTDTKVSSSVILVPQDLTEFTLEVTYNGMTYAAELTLPESATALAEGTNYTFTLEIDNLGLTVVAAEIADWNSTTNQEDYLLFSYTYTTDADGVRSYTVYNEDGLNTWADYVNDGNYSANCTLAADIALTEPAEGESNWTPIGSSSDPYTGTFDGNGYTISNLTLNEADCDDGLGLINHLGEESYDDEDNPIYVGEVKNLTLTDVNITTTDDDSWKTIGTIAATLQGGTVTNCHVSGTITGGFTIGGVVGDLYMGTVIACYTTGTFSGNELVGGVVGMNEEGTVIACYSTATVSATSLVGGVVGNNSNGTVTACYFAGAVSGKNSGIGGVVGYIEGDEGTISTCYWTNSISGTGAATYGIGGDDENGSNTGATQVTGDVTWSSAASNMNNELTDWEYVVTSSDPPLTLQAQ